jgi:diguanylate cyclase (GGDEF)-like protein
MFDVDSFKKFNDFCSHQLGDDCLTSIAEALSDALKRPGDVVARYGGEEFIVVLPATDAQSAAEVAEAMRASVEELHITYGNLPSARLVTISLGITTGCPTRGFSTIELIAAADQALYQAKQAGRNQVVLSREIEGIGSINRH